MVLNQITTKEINKSIFTFDSSKALLVVRIKPLMEFEKEDSISMMGEVEQFVGNVRHKALIEMGDFNTSSAESRKLYAESEYINKYRIADAFLVKSLATRLLINFFINVSKPKIPTRAFSNEEEALEWLGTFSIHTFSDSED